MFRSFLLLSALLCGCASAPAARQPPQPEPPLPLGGSPATPITHSTPVPGEPEEVTAVCAEVPCRWVEAVGQRMPYAYQGDVIVAAGESFAISGTEEDGLLTDVHLLDGQATGGRRIVVSWERASDGSQSLTVSNGFPLRLRYRGMRLTPADTEFEDTDSCAVAGHTHDTRSIGATVKLVALTGLEFVGENTFDACEAEAEDP